MRVSCRADQTNGAGGGGAPGGGFGNLEGNDGSNNPAHMPHATSFTSASNSATSLAGSELLSTNPSLRSTSSSSTTTTATTASGPPHYVDLHVSPGECVSLQLLDGQEQVVAGPATITMISQQQTPPVPIPVQVPHGHMIHQIADENGTLKHIILSVMDTDKNSAMDSSVIDFPHASFRIDSLGELVSTIDGQMYGYPACCCCCYCDPDEQNAAAAAAAAAAAGVPLGPNGQPALPLAATDPLMTQQQQQQDVIMMALMQQDIGPSPGRRGNNNSNNNNRSSSNISTAYHNNNNNNHHHNHHTTQSNLQQQVGSQQSAYHPMSPLMTHNKEFGRGKAHHHGKGPRGQNLFKQQQQQQHAKLSHNERAAHHHHHHQNPSNNSLEHHHAYNNHTPTYTSVASGGARNLDNNLASHKHYPLIQSSPMKQQQQQQQQQPNSTPQQQPASPAATTTRATAAQQHQQQQHSRRSMSPMFVHNNKEFSRAGKQHQVGGKSSRGSSAYKQLQAKATNHVERPDPNEAGDHNHNNHRHPSQNHNYQQQQQQHNNNNRTSDSNHISSHHNHDQQRASEPESLPKKQAEKNERNHHEDVDEVGSPVAKQVGTNPASSTSCDSGVSVAALEGELTQDNVERTASTPLQSQPKDDNPSELARDSSIKLELVLKDELDKGIDLNVATSSVENAAESRDGPKETERTKTGNAKSKQFAGTIEKEQTISSAQDLEQAQASETATSQPPVVLNEQQPQPQQQPQRQPKVKKQTTGDQSNSNKRNKDNIGASPLDKVQQPASGKQKKNPKSDAVKRSTVRQQQRSADGAGANGQVAADDKSKVPVILTESLVKVAEAAESGKPQVQLDKRTSIATITTSSGAAIRREANERTVNAKSSASSSSSSSQSSSEQMRSCPPSSRAKDSNSLEPLEPGHRPSNNKQAEPIQSSAKHHHHHHQHLANRMSNSSLSNKSSNNHNNNNNYQHQNHHHHHNHHNNNNNNHNSNNQQSVRVSNIIRQYRNKFATNVGKMVQNSLSSYSDTKFAGLLLIIFTMFAMLLAIFIHYYIIAPVNA